MGEDANPALPNLKRSAYFRIDLAHTVYDIFRFGNRVSSDPGCGLQAAGQELRPAVRATQADRLAAYKALWDEHSGKQSTAA